MPRLTDCFDPDLVLKAMLEKGFDTSSLAEASGCSVRTISRLLKGEAKDAKTRLAVATALGKKVQELRKKPPALGSEESFSYSRVDLKHLHGTAVDMRRREFASAAAKAVYRELGRALKHHGENELPALRLSWDSSRARAEFQEAGEYAKLLRQKAKTRGDRVFAASAVGQNYLYTGRITRAIKQLEQVVSDDPTDFDREEYVKATGVNPWSEGRSQLAFAHAIAGNTDQADDHARLAVSLADSTENQGSLAVACHLMTAVYQQRQDYESVIEWSKKTRSLAEGKESRLMPLSGFFEAWGRTMSGEAPDVESMEKAIAAMKEASYLVAVPYWQALLAESHLSIGDTGEARSVLWEAEKFASRGASLDFPNVLHLAASCAESKDEANRYRERAAAEAKSFGAAKPR